MLLQTFTRLPSLREFSCRGLDEPCTARPLGAALRCRRRPAVAAASHEDGSTPPPLPRLKVLRAQSPTTSPATGPPTASPTLPPQAAVLRVEPEAVAPLVNGQQLLRVLAVTDLHVDYDENMEWCYRLDNQAFKTDVLIVCGDVSDELAALETALGTLASKFGHVFYVPGNHELWIRERDRDMGITDSHTKLRIILERCRQLGVHTQPMQLGGLWIVPLLSWHHRSFDKEADVPGVPPASAWTITDYSACRWPSSVPGGSTDGSEQLAAYIDSMNEGFEWQALLENREQFDVISFSHFLPNQALLPEKRYLYYPNLAKAVGSDFLAARVAQLKPDLHLFGHTHFAWDACLGGTRYIQAPLCSPLERRKRLFTVGFGACMEEAEADPVAARWLPQQVYIGLAPQPAAAAEVASADVPGEQRQTQQAQQQQQQQQPSRAEWRRQPQVLPDAAAATGQQAAARQPSRAEWRRQPQVLPDAAAATGQQAAAQHAGSNGRVGQDEQAEAEAEAQQSEGQQGAAQQPQGTRPQGRKAAGGAYDPMPAVARLQLQIEMELAFGWQPLRHGAAVPSLLAHWSLYYEEHPRQPDVVTLAPWVARLYERRLHRRQSAAARVMRSTAAAEEGSGDEVEAEEESTALTSLSEDDNESATGF